jgi:hypothetical protein
MKSNICALLGSASIIGTVALAALTPATDQNRAPMAALILAGGILAPAALIAAAREEA